jgi:predicted PurR-regulated permease PerM
MTNEQLRRWQWLAVLVLVGIVIWLLAPILTPFVISAMLGWLGDPLVDRLERRGYSRGIAVVIVFASMTTVLAIALLILLPMLWEQIASLIDWLPRLALWTTAEALPWIERRFRLDLSQYVDPAYLFGVIRTHWDEAGGVAAALLGRLSQSGLVLFGILANIALVPVLSFYFLRDWDVFIGKVAALIPRPMLPTVSRLAGESNEVLGGFLRGQLSVMVALGAIYAFGLWAVGLELGLLIGFIAGLVSFVPYLGAFVGVTAAIIATLVQHGDLLHLALVLGVFGVGQALESFILTPWLVGDRIGLHPVAVIFAIMAGGQLFGFLGVLLALPAAAVAMVLLRYAHQRYTSSGLYGAEVAVPDPGALVLEPLPLDEGAPPPAALPPIPPVTPP